MGADDFIAMRNVEQRGHRLAVVASVILLSNTLILLITGAAVFEYSWFHRSAIQHLLAESYLPLVIYLMWAMGLAGAVAALGAIVYFDFRERWFWRCLVIASVSWLAFPPVHTLIGLFALVLLIGCRRAFPHRQSAATPAS